MPGGTAANVAVAAARLLGPKTVAVFGAVGADDKGRLLIEDLARERVDTSLIQTIDDIATGQAFILIDAHGENIIHSFLEANGQLKIGATATRIRKSLAAAEIVVVMDPPISVAEQIFRSRKKPRLFTLWDPGIFVDLDKARLIKLADLVTMLALNEPEAKSLFGSLNPKRVSERYKGSLLVKRGKKGSALYHDGFVENFVTVPLEKIGLRVASTVGCGDAFIGAYAAFKHMDIPEEEAILRANCAAAFKATRAETRGSPIRKEFDRFLSEASKFLVRRQ